MEQNASNLNLIPPKPPSKPRFSKEFYIVVAGMIVIGLGVLNTVYDYPKAIVLSFEDKIPVIEGKFLEFCRDYPIAIVHSLQDKVPINIEKKYLEFRRDYPMASLYRCSGDNGTVYQVGGGWGDSGRSDYFRENGRYISSYIVPGDPSQRIPQSSPPIDQSKYNCEMIRIKRPHE